MKYIISGGGTGGHIFPAISIANEIKQRDKEAEILFVGALGRMEMERVPQAGYEIVGLPVRGLDRKNILKNFGVVIDLFKSILKAKKIIRQFKPDIAIGVGGYASAPTLKAASRQGVPTLLQEQNSYAGVTNKLLAKKASKICVAYDGMEKFFPSEKIVITGNPIRQDLFEIDDSKKQAGYDYFGLSNSKKTILFVGGSLGARTINESVANSIDKIIKQENVQIIWQTGKTYINKAKERLATKQADNIYVSDFISRMDYAYAIADLIISRSGASSISELCILGKPVILVPSPNVAEDHQTMNALALSNKNAAILIRDNEANEKLIDTAMDILKNETKLGELSNNIIKLAHHNSAEKIVDEVFKIIQTK